MLFNHEGQHVPQVTFHMFVRMFGEVCWYDCSTADLFDRKTVVVFAVSGAFTPYSQTQLLLGYNEYAEMFLEPDGFETIPLVSAAETMLNYINPAAKQPDRTMLAA
jgi:peroxiredoxin